MSEKISVMLSEEDLDKRIRELGAQISEDYKGEEILLVGVLKGANVVNLSRKPSNHAGFRPFLMSKIPAKIQ